MSKCIDIAVITSLLGELIIIVSSVVVVVAIVGLEMNYVSVVHRTLIEALELADGSTDTYTEGRRSPLRKEKVDGREGQLLNEAIDKAL